MFCRLGTGDIDFQVDIQIPKEKFSVTYDGLKDKPAMLYDNFKKLNNVPVGIDLQSKNCGVLQAVKIKPELLKLLTT